jgi:hypothetical protein
VGVEVPETWGLVWRHFDDVKLRGRSFTADVEFHRAPHAADVLVALR